MRILNDDNECLEPGVLRVEGRDHNQVEGEFWMGRGGVCASPRWAWDLILMSLNELGRK